MRLPLGQAADRTADEQTLGLMIGERNRLRKALDMSRKMLYLYFDPHSTYHGRARATRLFDDLTRVDKDPQRAFHETHRLHAASAGNISAARGSMWSWPLPLN